MTTTSLLQEEAVLAALEAMRTGRTLGDHPLRYFQSVRIPRHLLAGDTAVQYAIYHHLAQVITEKLAQHRRVFDLPTPDTHCSDFCPVEDFQHENVELEAWSVLYHRFVCIDHGLSPTDLAGLVSVDERTIRRRLRRGLTRLTFALVEKEQEVRQQRKREHVLLALPTQHPPRLFGNESVLLTSRHLLTEANPPHHVVLHGPGGIGKSTLAKNLAYDLVSSEQFDDFVWLEVDDPAYLLVDISVRLGMPAETDILASLDALRAYLFDHSVLIVLDGAEALIADPQCADLLTTLDTASVVLTSQHAPSPNLWCYTIELSDLTREQAFEYLDYVTHQLSERRLPNWIDRFDDVWQAVGGNPRALKWLLHTACSLPLDAAIASHENLSTAITRLWDQLTSTERRIMLLPMFCFDEGILYEQILALSGLETVRVNRAIESLVNRAVLFPHHESDTVRYTLQPINLTLLIDQVRRGLAISPQNLAMDFIREVLSRIVDQLASQVLIETGTIAPTQALCVLKLTYDLDFEPEERWHYAHQLAELFTTSAQWSSWAKVLASLLDLSLEPSHTAWVHLALGTASRWLGQLDHARAHLEQAYTYYADQDDPILQANVQIELAVIHRYQLRWDEARRLAQTALNSYQRVDHIDGCVRCLHELAQLALEEHDPAQALSWLDRLGDWMPRTWGIASQAHLALAQHDLALEAAERALENLPLSHPNCGRTENTLGQIYYALGNTDAAITSLVSATLLLDEAKDLLGYARACNNLAVAYLDNMESQAESAAAQESGPEIREEHTRRARAIYDLLHRARAIQEHVGDEMGLLVTDQNLAWVTRRFPDQQCH